MTMNNSFCCTFLVVISLQILHMSRQSSFASNSDYIIWIGMTTKRSFHQFCIGMGIISEIISRSALFHCVHPSPMLAWYRGKDWILSINIYIVSPLSGCPVWYSGFNVDMLQHCVAWVFHTFFYLIGNGIMEGQFTPFTRELNTGTLTVLNAYRLLNYLSFYVPYVVTCMWMCV